MNAQRYRTRPMEERIERLWHCLADTAMRGWPRPVPANHLLGACRIIAHRGEHDNRSRIENTLPAFDAAADAGIWGIEMDIRWTSDRVPLVCHDPDTRRLFGRDTWIAHTPLDRIKRNFPAIPTLREVVARYGGRLHLMLEIKREPYPRPWDQAQTMRQVMRDLAPGVDYHLMSLYPSMFAFFEWVPPEALLPIARVRIDRFSRLAARRGWGGLAGHYLLATNGLLARHHRLGQGVGTGFVDSPRTLHREVARGVDWIFSNCAAALQAEVRRLKSEV